MTLQNLFLPAITGVWKKHLSSSHLACFPLIFPVLPRKWKVSKQVVRSGFISMSWMAGLYPISPSVQIHQGLAPSFDLVFDTHLMVDEPERFITHFAQSGSDHITVHAEATVHLHRTLQIIRDCGCKAGVSLIPSSSVSSILPILDMVDLILIMTVNPGFGGQSLIPSTLEKIGELASSERRKDTNI